MAYIELRVLIRQEHILVVDLMTIQLLSIIKEDLCEFDFGVSILILYYKYSYFGCILRYHVCLKFNLLFCFSHRIFWR